MNETVRTLTLRKKGGRKQQISAPKQISGPTSTEKPGRGQLEVPRDRPGQSETSDIVKRRYSTRFNQLPDFSSGAPAVPGLPGHLKRSSHGGSPTRPARSGPAHAHALQVDANALADPNLKPERCRSYPCPLSLPLTLVYRCDRAVISCIGAGHTGLSEQFAQGQEPNLHRPSAERLPESNTIHQDQQGS